ncbi:WD40 repeat-like protein [Choiromyces venosus 120613-1]|uniref:Pre-rRNA-processing protein IPI3 n=1 Tax=Choiromyces venosus 120613-1 TaxID=1336337 RepID=A0A3N4JE64_9PEZI|nr:WD40 repeat-like protein [Choiromyces venosus 120613-1]
MLNEQVVISTFRPIPDASSVATAEPTIAFYDLHTFSQTAVFKRSTTAKNCLAITDSHLFAAQSDKAVVNIYSREKGNLEATVPFKEKFTVLEAGSKEIVAGGTEDGRLVLWETATGRYISTQQAHLQKVTSIVFDCSSNFVITGSADSNVYVWSIPALLDIRTGGRSPLHILDRHTREITALITGRAAAGGPSDILLTASRDQSVVAWDFHTGTHLRTYIFSSIPTCLAIDPVDRVFYAGLEDGGIQSVDFFNPTDGVEDTTSNQLFAGEFRDMPITLPEKRWFASGIGGVITTLGVVFEGNYVVSGNENGDVCVWDVATGHMFRSLVKFKASIASLKVLPPTGFTPLHSEISEQKHQQTNILKPRYDAIVSPSVDDLYGYTVSTKLLTPSLPGVVTSPLTSMQVNLSTSFSPENDLHTLQKQADEMAAYRPALVSKHKTEALEAELRILYEQYDRLATLHNMTWEGMVKEALE